MNSPAISALGSGLLLGLCAGFSPGPLMALVMSLSLRHTTRAGGENACSPLITDIPIIALTLGTLAVLPRREHVIGYIAIAGALFVAKLGIESLRSRPVEPGSAPPPANALLKGSLVNLLSPHPWIFWLTVGGPIMMDAAQQGTVVVLAFLGGFYVPLVGAKIFVAAGMGHARRFFTGQVYIRVMQLLGVALLLFSLGLLRSGLAALSG